MPKNAQALAAEIQSMWEAADRENRGLTVDERRYVGNLIDEAKSQQALERKMGALNGAADGFRGVGGPGGGPGDLFVKSEGWRKIADPGTRPQTWSSGAVEVSSGPLLYKAGTVFEGGQGAGLIAVPQVVPGVVDKLFEQLGVVDLLPSSPATTSSLRYIVEGTATSGAAGVAEGGAKPASDLAYSTVDEPVKKIATTLTVSDELLEDATSIQAYLNSRLSLFVRIEEERQLLRGAGTNELVGIMGRSGVSTYTKLAADDNAVALLKVLNNTRGSSFLEPDGIIMHPTNWLNTRLLRDGTGGTVGQFYGGGPFTAAYGGPQGPAGVFVDTLWNKRVVLSTVVGPGTALVGSFGQAARVYRRGGVTVEATNSHASYFTDDLVALRAEQREALAVFRPVAFTEVRGLT